MVSGFFCGQPDPAIPRQRLGRGRDDVFGLRHLAAHPNLDPAHHAIVLLEIAADPHDGVLAVGGVEGILVFGRSRSAGVHRHGGGVSLVVVDPDDADVECRVVDVQLDLGFRTRNLDVLLDATERVEGSPQHVVAGLHDPHSPEFWVSATSSG